MRSRSRPGRPSVASRAKERCGLAATVAMSRGDGWHLLASKLFRRPAAAASATGGLERRPPRCPRSSTLLNGGPAATGASLTQHQQVQGASMSSSVSASRSLTAR
jgi:hypothetical protein